MNAKQTVAALLEAANPDDIDPTREAARYTQTMAFDKGIADIMRDARQLYLSLEKDGTLATLLKEGDYDESSVAQAIMWRAIERRSAPGAARALKRLKRLCPYNF